MRLVVLLLCVLATLSVSVSAGPAEPTSSNRLANGRLAYSLSDLEELDGYATLVVSDPNGARKRIIRPDFGGVYSEPDWSPDGTKLAFTYTNGTRYSGYDSDVYVANPGGSAKRRLVADPHEAEHSPAWSPAGTRIAYVQGYEQIYVVNADGSGKSWLTEGADPAWSPDGTRIAFARREAADEESDLYAVNADGTGRTQLTSGPGEDRGPEWSPDGSRVVFWRDVGPRHEPRGIEGVYEVAADGTGLRRLTRRRYDGAPTWSPDGRKIVFVRRGDLWVMSSDGKGAHDITPTSSISKDEGTPDWQPVRVVDGTMVGTRFDDYLAGGTERNTIDGKAGNDVIAGGGGRDVLVGGPGRDTFYAQDYAVDSIDGGPGPDRAFVDRSDRTKRVERVVRR